MRVLLRRFKRAGESAFQYLGRRWLRSLMTRRLREWPGGELGRPAVVFAPHQDDEVLGCGGTIIRKRRAGAKVTIAFMTDGSASHPHLIPGDEMTRIRTDEALAACRLLGVDSDDVLFLSFKDGQLGSHLDAAEQRVGELLRRLQPAEVFIPHYHDGSPDHLATTRAVLAALRAHHPTATVYEFPVWLWCHWPWISLPSRLSEIATSLQRSAEGNSHLVWDCRCFVRIGELLELKRAALDQHTSQLVRLKPDPNWFILGDVSNGEWLDCFFQEREIFYRHDPFEEGGRRT